MKFKVIKTLIINVEEFIKTDQINEDNIAEKVDRYCKELEECGYEILPREWKKLYKEIYKKLNENT